MDTIGFSSYEPVEFEKYSKQLTKLEIILEEDDVDALRDFLQNEQFILIIDEEDMRKINNSTATINLQPHEKKTLHPILTKDLYSSVRSFQTDVVVRILQGHGTIQKPFSIRNELFILHARKGNDREETVWKWVGSLLENRELWKYALLMNPKSREQLSNVYNFKHILVEFDRLVEFRSTNCLTFLLNPPNSWNVDLPGHRGVNVLHLAEFYGNLIMAIDLAGFSAELRPFPARFDLYEDVYEFQFPLKYILWPHVALFHQPTHMKFQILKATRPQIEPIRVETRGFEGRPVLQSGSGNLGSLYELLLANAELCNYDLTGDERLPFDDLDHLNSSRMWPLLPIHTSLIEEHAGCKCYPSCIELPLIMEEFIQNQSTRRRMFELWKLHRFGNMKYNADSSSMDLFEWGPPKLKEFCRMTIRRCMVKRVESSVHKLHEVLQLNQARLVNRLHLPVSLRDYLLYKDITFMSSPRLRRTSLQKYHYWEKVDAEKYGYGYSVQGAFIPDPERVRVD